MHNINYEFQYMMRSILYSIMWCHVGSAFSHCPVGVPIAEEYKKLRELLGEHARLQLQKDVNSRIHQFEIFIRNLKKLVQEETASWQAINHSKGTLTSIFISFFARVTVITVIVTVCFVHTSYWLLL